MRPAKPRAQTERIQPQMALRGWGKKSVIRGDKPGIFRTHWKPPIQAVTTAPTTQQIITFTTLPWQFVAKPAANHFLGANIT